MKILLEIIEITDDSQEIGIFDDDILQPLLKIKKVEDVNDNPIDLLFTEVTRIECPKNSNRMWIHIHGNGAF